MRKLRQINVYYVLQTISKPDFQKLIIKQNQIEPPGLKKRNDELFYDGQSDSLFTLDSQGCILEKLDDEKYLKMLIDQQIKKNSQVIADVIRFPRRSVCCENHRK